MLHGLASQRRFWNLVVERLSVRPILAIDARGHGDAERPSDGYDTATVAHDVVTAMDAAGIGRGVLVGHSWGALVAATVAADYPMRTACAVLIDGGFATPLAGMPHDEAREQLRPPQIDVDADQIESHVRQHHADYWSRDVEQAVLPIFGVDEHGRVRPRLPHGQHMQIVDELLSYDARATLSRVTCPCWAVSCEAGDNADWASRKRAALHAAGEALRAPRLLRWQSAGHDVPLQWPALVAGLVVQAVDDAGRTDERTSS